MGNTIIDVINPIDLKSRRKQIEKLIKQLEEHKRKGDLDKSTYDKIITEVLPEYKLKADLRDYKDNMLKLNKDNDDGDNEVDRIFMPHKLQDYVRENKSPAYYLTQASRCFNDQSKYKWYEITSEDKYKEYMKTSYAYITNNDWTKIRELRYEGLTKNFHISNLFDLNVPFKRMGNIIRKNKDVDMITSDFSYENVFDKLKDTANNVITNTESLSILSHSCSLNNDPINIQSIVNTYADNKILDKMGYIPNLIKSLNIMADKIRRILYVFYENSDLIDITTDVTLIALQRVFSLKNINEIKFINCEFMNNLQKNISNILKNKMSKEDISKVLLSAIELMEKYKTKDDTKDKNNSYTDIFYSILSTIKKANNEWYKTSINTTIDNTTSINDSIEYMKRELSNIYDDSGKLIYSQLILHYIDVIFNEETYKKLYKDDNGYTDTKNTILGVAIGYLTTIGVLIHLLQKEPSNVSHLSSNMIENTIYNSLLKSSNPDDSNMLVSYLLNEVLQSSSTIYTEDILFLSIVFDIKMIMFTMFSNYIDEHDISENTITFTKPGTYLIKYNTLKFNIYSLVYKIFNIINNFDGLSQYNIYDDDNNIINRSWECGDKKQYRSYFNYMKKVDKNDIPLDKKFLINLLKMLNIKQDVTKKKYQLKNHDIKDFLKYIEIYSKDPYRYKYINEIFSNLIHKLINMEQKYNIDTGEYEYYANIYTNYPAKPTEEDLKDKSEKEKKEIIDIYNKTIEMQKCIFKLQYDILKNINYIKMIEKYILIEYNGKTVTKIPDLNIIPDKNNMGRYNKAYFYDVFGSDSNKKIKIIVREVPLGANIENGLILEDVYAHVTRDIGSISSLYNRDMIYKNNLDDNKLGFMTTQISAHYGTIKNYPLFLDQLSGTYSMMTDLSIIPVSDKYDINFKTISDSKLFHTYSDYTKQSDLFPRFIFDKHSINTDYYIKINKEHDFRMNCLLAKPEYNGNNELTSYSYERLLRDYAIIFNYPYNYNTENQDDKMFLDTYSKNPICTFETTSMYRSKNYEPNIDINYSKMNYLSNKKIFDDHKFNKYILPEYSVNFGYLTKLLELSLIEFSKKFSLVFIGIPFKGNFLFNYRYIIGEDLFADITDRFYKDDSYDTGNNYNNLRDYANYSKDDKTNIPSLTIRNILDNFDNTESYSNKLANLVLLQSHSIIRPNLGLFNQDDNYNVSRLHFLQDYYWDIYRLTYTTTFDKKALFDYTQFASSDKFDTVNLLYGENIQKIIQDYKLEFTPSKENLSKILNCIKSLDEMSIKEYKEKYGLKNNHELVIDVTPTKNILDDVTATVKVTTNKNDKHTFLLGRSGISNKTISNPNNTPLPNSVPDPSMDKSGLQEFIDLIHDDIGNETYNQSDPETRDLFDSVYELCNRINDDFDVCQNYYRYSIAKDELLTKINDKIKSTSSSETYQLAVLLGALKGCDTITSVLNQCPSSPAISGKTNSNDNSTWNEDMKYILFTPVIKDISMYKIMKPLYTNGNDPYISTYHVYFNKEDIFGSIYNLYTGQLKETDKPSPCKDLSLSYIPVKNSYLSMEQRLWELAYNDARLKMLTMRVFLDSIHEISDKEKEKYETDFWKLYTSGKFEITIKNVEYTPLPDGYKEYLYKLLKDNKIGKKTMDMKNNYTNNEEYNNAVKVIYDKFIKKLKEKKLYDKHIEQVRKLLSPYAIAYSIGNDDRELTNEELEHIEVLIWRNYIVDRRFYHKGDPLSMEKDPYMLDYKKLAEIIDNIKDGSENPDSPYKGLKGTFGIERDLSNSATNAWRRIGDSANFRAVPIKCGESLDTYYSDFDKYYPWSEMKRVEKDGDILVLIPPFYYRRYQDDKIERIEISSDKKDGFELHPGSGVYVGAYLVDENTGNHSERGMKPKYNLTRGQFRSKIRERGSNYWMYDVKTDMALKMLYLVEYAENSTQALLNTNDKVYKSSDYRSGMGDALGDKTGCLSNYMGNYRGIEGLLNGAYYGCEFIDGLINDYGKYYISMDPNNYSDSHTTTGYKSLSYRVLSSNGYIKKHGLDTSNTWCMLPIESNGSEDTYFADYIWQYTDEPDRIACRVWDSFSHFGLFYLNVYNSVSASYGRLGARLIRSSK